MSKYIILRIYLALARDEHYTTSETDALAFYRQTDTLLKPLAVYPLLQKNWAENEKFRLEVCKAWGLSDEEFFAKGIIPKPSMIQNLVYSAELRRIFGIGKLRFLSEFDRDGNFILPKGNGFLILERENFRLVSWQALKQKAA